MADTITTGSSSYNVDSSVSYTITHITDSDTYHVHTLVATFGNYSQTILSTAGQTSTSSKTYSGTFTIPGSALSTSSSTSVTLTLTTIGATSGTTSTSTSSFTLMVPDYSSYMTNSSFSTSASFSNLKISNTYFLNGISSVTITATYSRKSNYGVYPYIRFTIWDSARTTRKWTGSRQIGSGGTCSVTFTTQGVSDAQVYISAYIFDDRGYASGSVGTYSSQKAITNYYKYSYTQPQITCELVRCESDGTTSASGNYVKFVGTATVTDINSANSGTSTAILDSTTMGTQSITAGSAVTLTTHITQKTSSGTGSVSVTDTVGYTTTTTLSYNTPFVIFASNENSVGVGGLPTTNKFDCYLQPKWHPQETEPGGNLFTSWSSSYGFTCYWNHEYRVGNLVHIDLAFSGGSTNPGYGVNVVEGVYCGTLPPYDVETWCYCGLSAFGIMLRHDGTFIIRHLSYATISYSGSTMFCNMDFIVPAI